jgi:hypothetical protein
MRPKTKTKNIKKTDKLVVFPSRLLKNEINEKNDLDETFIWQTSSG